MEIFLSGKVPAAQSPWLHYFLSRTNMRSFHGRSMMCRLIDRALTLTDEDIRRYSALHLSGKSSPSDDKDKRRFRFVISDDEHPETFRRLEGFGIEQTDSPRFLHLLEMAAGVIYLDSIERVPATASPFPVAQTVAQVAPMSAPAQVAPPPLAPKAEVAPRPALPHIAAGVVESSVTRSVMAELDESDLAEIFH